MCADLRLLLAAGGELRVTDNEVALVSGRSARRNGGLDAAGGVGALSGVALIQRGAVDVLLSGEDLGTRTVDARGVETRVLDARDVADEAQGVVIEDAFIDGWVANVGFAAIDTGGRARERIIHAVTSVRVALVPGGESRVGAHARVLRTGLVAGKALVVQADACVDLAEVFGVTLTIGRADNLFVDTATSDGGVHAEDLAIGRRSADDGLQFASSGVETVASEHLARVVRAGVTGNTGVGESRGSVQALRRSGIKRAGSIKALIGGAGRVAIAVFCADGDAGVGSGVAGMSFAGPGVTHLGLEDADTVRARAGVGLVTLVARGRSAVDEFLLATSSEVAAVDLALVRALAVDGDLLAAAVVGAVTDNTSTGVRGGVARIHVGQGAAKSVVTTCNLALVVVDRALSVNGEVSAALLLNARNLLTLVVGARGSADATLKVGGDDTVIDFGAALVSAAVFGGRVVVGAVEEVVLALA